MKITAKLATLTLAASLFGTTAMAANVQAPIQTSSLQTMLQTLKTQETSLHQQILTQEASNQNTEKNHVHYIKQDNGKIKGDISALAQLRTQEKADLKEYNSVIKNVNSDINKQLSAVRANEKAVRQDILANQKQLKTLTIEFYKTTDQTQKDAIWKQITDTRTKISTDKTTLENLLNQEKTILASKVDEIKKGHYLAAKKLQDIRSQIASENATLNVDKAALTKAKKDETFHKNRVNQIRFMNQKSFAKDTSLTAQREAAVKKGDYDTAIKIEQQILQNKTQILVDDKEIGNQLNQI